MPSQLEGKGMGTLLKHKFYVQNVTGHAFSAWVPSHTHLQWSMWGSYCQKYHEDSNHMFPEAINGNDLICPPQWQRPLSHGRATIASTPLHFECSLAGTPYIAQKYTYSCRSIGPVSVSRWLNASEQHSVVKTNYANWFYGVRVHVVPVTITNFDSK